MDQITATGGTVTLVHLTHEVPSRAGTEWRIACMGNMTEFHQTQHHPSYQRTNDVRAVTCPGCKVTTTYREMVETLEAVLRGPINAK